MYKVLRLRHRYIFTKGNRLRLRYVLGCLLVGGLSLTSLMGSSPSSVAYYAPDDYAAVQAERPVAVAEGRHEDIAFSERAAHKLTPLMITEEADPADDFVVSLDDVPGRKPEQPLDRILKVGAGDTIAGVLQKAGLNGAEVYRAVKAMGKHHDPRSVKAGQVVSVSMEKAESGRTLKTLSMKLDSTREVVVEKDAQGRFVSEIDEKEVVLRHKVAQVSIQTSLYGSAARVGIPASVVAEMIRIYSYEVDFQRDLRQGDKVEILYETYETEDGDFARYGNILYASLMVRGKSIPVYRFKKHDGAVDYFHESGINLKRTLMQTPIDGARMSSGYGMRKHPILGYNKMHKGVDFAAPRGTPVYAAGDGVIDKIGRNGGYGHYIRIRHNGALKTAYAHLHRYAKGMKRGKRLKQGQVIGYVGSTGRSTGPHLHFEVISHGKQINPKKVKTAAREKLAGNAFKRFKSHIADLQKIYVSLMDDVKVARTEISQ